jgi:large subunit ribosomal protein L4
MAEKKQKATAKTASKAAPRTPAPKAPAKAAKPRKPKGKPPTAAAEEKAPKAGKGDFATAAVVDAENQQVREVALHPEVFGVRVNEHLLYEAVKHYRAGGRRGTHMTKNRALVAGTGKKPWRQKGTGRARVGEIRNPLWRHGGTVFGPVPRDYSYRMPAKARAAALRSALSKRAREGALLVVAGFPIDQPKTKALRGLLDKLGVVGKTTLVDHEPSDALVLSGRNLPDLNVVADTHLSVYDVLDCRNLLVSEQALDKLEERLTP